MAIVGRRSRGRSVGPGFTSRLVARGMGLSVFSVSLILLLSVFVGLAEAAPETIAEYGEGAGQVSGPDGVALDRSNGDFYVADFGNARIDKFDEKGHFLFAWGWGVRDGLGGFQTCGPRASPPSNKCFAGNLTATGPGAITPTGVAVAPSTNEVYVTDKAHSRVSKFTSSGQFVFTVGKNVNKSKVALGGATEAEMNICTAASGDECGSGESGTGPDEFSETITTVAVSSTGVVWVGDENRLTSFDSSSGAAGAEIALTGASYTRSLALDSADDFYVISASVPGVRKLEAGSGTPLETLDAGGQPRTVTVDEADNVYVGDQTPHYRFKVYDSAGNQTTQFGAGQVVGEPGAGDIFGGNAIAVGDAAGELYAASSIGAESESVVQAFPLPESGPLPENQHVENLEPTTVTLAADLNPEGRQTTYHFEWGTTEGYGESTPPKTLTAEEFEPEKVEADLQELIPSTTYHFRLCATNSEGEVCGPDTVFTTLPAVVIGAQWASEVAAHSATLNAEMNPLGVEAEAWLEYGTDEGYGQVVPLANLGEGFGAVLREASLTGLQPTTTYDYRFAARDTRDGHVYEVHGEPKRFTTQSGGLGFELADNRVWELVSPPDKHGAILVMGGEAHRQASLDGNGFAYQSVLSTEIDPEGNRLPEASMNLAHREADGVWRSKDITPPNDRVKPLPSGNGTEYKLFSPVLSEALLEPRSGTPLSPEASERTPYLRRNSEPPAYQPLVTDKEGFADVPPGTGFGGEDEPGRSIARVRIQAATPDLRHVVLRSEVPLGPETAPIGVYEWTNYADPSTRLKRVSVLPPAEGGGMVVGSPGSEESSVRGAISDDGSRVFWTAASPAHLYLRYNAAEAPSATVHAAGTGTVTAGSSQVTSLVAAAGAGDLTEGSAEVTSLATTSGSFLAGQPIAGEGIPAGTTITAVTETTLTLSAKVEAGKSGTGVALSSEGPAPFAVGQTISGAGIPSGTRITAVAPGSLALSAQATASHPAEGLEANSPCLEPEKACTVRIDVPQPGATGVGNAEPIFQGASADGSVVFFTDSQQLTEDASSRGADLYRCGIPPGGAASGCATLRDLSVPVDAGRNAEVQGIAAAIAEDGRTIYFVAKGILDTAPNQLGQSAVAGEPNLYVWQQDSGVRFIGTLAGTEGANWGLPPGKILPGSASWLSAASSPSGRYFAFMTKRALTTADTTDAASGEAVEEVYRYDATTEQLECVSCDPTGSRASSLVPAASASLVDPRSIWENQAAAAILPEAISIFGGRGGVTLYRPRSVLDNGRTFFNAAGSLVPADSNGQWDVYQYESAGVGDCAASSGGAAIVHVAGGCVSLISSGTAEEEAGFMDASATGDDAFFLTSAQLSVLDEDHQLDIYDARVGGVAATPPTITECLGEACQPAAQSPDDPTPASAAFNGAGNVKSRRHCRRGKRLAHHSGKARCVTRRRSHRKHRRGHTHQGAHR